MSTPFPGMDPYLERPGLWEGVHTRLIVAIADALAPLVRPKYRVDVEIRTYLTVLTPDEFVGKPVRKIAHHKDTHFPPPSAVRKVVAGERDTKKTRDSFVSWCLRGLILILCGAKGMAPDVLIFQPTGPPPREVAPAFANSGVPMLAEIPMPEEIVERFLEIREVRTADVITVIEILSPANKVNVTGRQEYNSKRQKVLGSQTHLIEIDLLHTD